MHTLLESRAHEFDGCTESSPEEAEYISLVEAIEAYEQRWCDCKIPAVRASWRHLLR